MKKYLNQLFYLACCFYGAVKEYLSTTPTSSTSGGTIFETTEMLNLL